MPNVLTYCPLCKAEGPFPIYNPAPVACHSYETMPEGVRLDQCTHCRLIFLNPQPTPEESLAYEAADEQWYPTQDLTEQDRTSHERDAQWTLHFMGRFQPHPGRLLDVGSSRGFLLDAARAAGYQAQGIEPTVRTAEFSRREFGADVLTGLLADAPFGPASFDTIVLWHVLEHVPALPAFLAEIAALLKEGGFLFIQVPYLDCWPRPVHFNHFGCDLVVRLLRDVGLSAAAAEVTAGGFLTVAAVRGDPQALPTEADAALWNALALEHQDAERAADALRSGALAWERRLASQEARLASQEARLASQEARLASQEARLASQEARLASQEAEYRQGIEAVYSNIARRPSSRLARAVRRLLPNPNWDRQNDSKTA